MNPPEQELRVRARFPKLKIDDDLALLAGHGMVDGALTFAGGLSVPGLLTSMLGVLFSNEHGDFSSSYQTDEFVYETVRFLPAVVGVPWVETGSTRRQALALPAALTDKKVTLTCPNTHYDTHVCSTHLLRLDDNCHTRQYSY